MVRLTVVFAVWLASTAHAVPDPLAAADDEMHQAFVLAWTRADDERRRLLDVGQRAWTVYREAHCRLLGKECYPLMAHERAAELRDLERLQPADEDETP
ncbi:MAG TPA: lysozyme inhibitor LprI family protein [Burkholderiales bacterium]|nr:lysozyme inhibitor LprI family protein [Burkholderiales bacterium]